jgi:hypothetical protein
VIVVEVQRIADSCGCAVPLSQYTGERDLLERWTDGKDDATLAAYRASTTAPASTADPRSRKEPMMTREAAETAGGRPGVGSGDLRLAAGQPRLGCWVLR